jgi:hypothetical protein
MAESSGVTEAPAAEDADQIPFELAQRLKELEALARETPQGALPDRVSVSEVETLPELFQPRGRVDLDEHHVGELERGLKISGDLDPILVKWIGAKPHLIDGHHRLEAYRRSGDGRPIPVRAFDGSVQEAVLEAGRANSRAELPMSPKERQSFAWRLVLLGGYSKPKTAEAAGISPRQVAIMRDVKRTLGASAFDCRDWWRARQMAAGISSTLRTDDEEEAWLQQQAEQFADRMSRAFSSTLSTNPELAARALAIYFGRNLGRVVNELQGFVPEPEDDPVADF